MIDGGERSDRASDEADPALTWAWEQLVGSGDMSSTPRFDPVRRPEKDAIPSSPDAALVEEIWADGTADKPPAELEFVADAHFADIWSLAQQHGAPPLDESLVVDPPRGNVEGLTVGATSVTTPAVRRALRRPAPSPVPVPDGRRSGQRRVLGELRAAPRVAALALVVIATAGLLLALSARRTDTPPVDASQQIDAADLQSTSIMPTSVVPRTPSTTLATSPPSRTIDGEATHATVAPPSADATVATTPTITATPRSPAPSEATIAPVQSPQEPPLAPVTTATVAPPPPATIVLLPPGTTVTTRRPRSTVPETTVGASTTVPTLDDLPAEQG